MSDAKYDITLQSWMDRGAKRLASVAEGFDNAIAKRALGMTVELLNEAYGPYKAMTDRLEKENKEAALAAQRVARAEVRVEENYRNLNSAAQIFVLKANINNNTVTDVEKEEFEMEMGKAMPLNPSQFNALGAARTLVAMRKAVDFGVNHLGADDPVVADAVDALESFQKALDTADAEQSDVVRAMQQLFGVREEAKKAYVSARLFVEGALNLEDDESIKQFMPAISTMYGSGKASKKEEDEKPVEA